MAVQPKIAMPIWANSGVKFVFMDSSYYSIRTAVCPNLEYDDGIKWELAIWGIGYVLQRVGFPIHRAT